MDLWVDFLRLDKRRKPTGVAIDLSETIHVTGRRLPAFQLLIVTGRDVFEEIRHVFPKPKFPVLGA